MGCSAQGSWRGSGACQAVASGAMAFAFAEGHRQTRKVPFHDIGKKVYCIRFSWSPNETTKGTLVATFLALGRGKAVFSLSDHASNPCMIVGVTMWLLVVLTVLTKSPDGVCIRQHQEALQQIHTLNAPNHKPKLEALNPKL